jgi:thioredoxin 1
MKMPARWTLGLFLMMGCVGLASAAEPYTDKRFAALTGAGKNVVLDVHADWCPTCQRQQPVLLKLVEAAPYQEFQVLVVDYDDQGDVRKRFKVPSQSTLVVFKGATEVARATGITDSAQIAALLDKARK